MESKNTHKNIKKDILSPTWYAQHNQKHGIMHEHVIKTCKTSIISSSSTKPIHQFHQRQQKPMFINHISISQHKQQIHEK